MNDIRRRAVTSAQIVASIEQARGGPVAEGAVGAGTGTVAFGWKGGIGSSSRALPERLGGYTIGVLVQSNFGGVLQILGLPVGKVLGQTYLRQAVESQPTAQTGAGSPDGSIMIVVAPDAPLSDRNLTRRALAGLARTGAAMSNGSGDYAISFSTAAGVRRTPKWRAALWHPQEVPNERVSPLFQAVIEATEEAIYNSLFRATTVTGYQGLTVEALPLDRVKALFDGLSSKGYNSV